MAVPWDREAEIVYIERWQYHIMVTVDHYVS